MSELKRRLFRVVGDGGQSERQKRVEPIEEVREGIAQLLKQTRERYGQSLRDVSASLRIRLAYLQAIESGRFRELPGTTYAVGFVRSYAEYLGLDANEIVRRFKGEVEGLDNRTQLAFPEPVPEGKVPGGAIIIVSLVVLAIGYGGWYAISNRDAEGQGLIPRVSESLKGLLGKSDQKSETAAASIATPAQPVPSEAGKSAAPAPSAPATPTTERASTNSVPARAAISGANVNPEANVSAGLIAGPAATPGPGGQTAGAQANSVPEEVVVGSTEEDDASGSGAACPSSWGIGEPARCTSLAGCQSDKCHCCASGDEPDDGRQPAPVAGPAGELGADQGCQWQSNSDPHSRRRRANSRAGSAGSYSLHRECRRGGNPLGWPGPASLGPRRGGAAEYPLGPQGSAAGPGRGLAPGEPPP